MNPAFSHPAGMRVLESLRAVFEEKPVYLRNDPVFVFVCGGQIGNSTNRSLRQQFLQWASHSLPNFICLLAEDALPSGFSLGSRRFINLTKFESLIADIAHCILIFPESPGSFAETGFFSNSPKIRRKTLVINPIAEQSDSFLNLGPIHLIDQVSWVGPKLLIGSLQPADFGLLGQRLAEKFNEPYRDQLEYRKFKEFNFKEKLSVIFELLRMLRLADSRILEHAISVCFTSKPQPEQLANLLRILQAARLVHKGQDSSYFRVVSDRRLIDIENVNAEQIFAQVTLYYQKYAKHLLLALGEVGNDN
jgi:hypothetical protein